MARLEWDKDGERLYETGVQNCVLYPKATTGTYNKGVAWNGITAVNETPSGAEATALYADNIKYLTLKSVEELGGSIEAYMYPEEWKQCDGSAELAPGVYIHQQSRRSFGLCYRSEIGNDVVGTDYGYKLHLIYGCDASPSERPHSTINDSPEATTMSWEFTTTPVKVAGFKPTSALEIDSTKVDVEKLKALEDVLYGTEAEEARLPLPDEVATLLAAG